MDEIATFVRNKRKEAGLTQETLALYAGVSAKFVVELEAGKKTLRVDKIVAVLNVFDCVLDVRHR